MVDLAMVKVPIGDGTEVGLMLALDSVVQHFLMNAFPRPLTEDEARRAVEWLYARGVRALRDQRPVAAMR